MSSPVKGCLEVASVGVLPPKRGEQSHEKRRIQAVRARWLGDVEKEFERLQRAEIIGDIGGLTGSLNDESLRRQEMCMMVSFGRAMEIKALYEETHTVFTHGMGVDWEVLTWFIKECEKSCHPEGEHSCFKYFRVNQGSGKYQSSCDFLQKHDGLRDNDDNDIPWDIMSVDVNPTNYESGESALFFIASSNIGSLSIETIEMVVSHYFPKMLQEEKYDVAKVVLEIGQRYQEQKQAAQFLPSHLHVICVPKSTALQSHERGCGYLSRPFGKPMGLPNEEDVIERAQSGLQENALKKAQLQYRLIPSVSTFSRKHGVRIFRAPDDSPEFRAPFKQEMKELVRALAIRGGSEKKGEGSSCLRAKL